MSLLYVAIYFLIGAVISIGTLKIFKSIDEDAYKSVFIMTYNKGRRHTINYITYFFFSIIGWPIAMIASSITAMIMLAMKKFDL